MYNDAITCTANDCYFSNHCWEVKQNHQHPSIYMALGNQGDSLGRKAIIELDLDQYLIMGSELGKSDDVCFFPIFVVNPDNNEEAKNTWFLGNMFMDKYFIINNYERVYKSASNNVSPIISIYDKTNPKFTIWTPVPGEYPILRS